VTSDETESGLTIFIPVYNEEDVLEHNVGRLKAYLGGLNRPYEIIVGSNGSNDRTVQYGHRLSRKNEEVVFFHIPKRGPGLAFREALTLARYSNLLCLDVDLSVDLDYISRAASILEDYDAVVGAKQTGDQRRPVLRVLASDFFVFCSNVLLKLPYRDYSIGAKAYRTDSVRPFLRHVDRHTFYTQHLLYRLQQEGKKITEIPVNCRDHRKSKFNLLHEGFYRFYKLFALYLKNDRQ
jgi:glycosyltransferase involved in cell wall biosynthesis